jgi:hypothetical protein
MQTVMQRLKCRRSLLIAIAATFVLLFSTIFARLENRYQKNNIAEAERFA